MDRPPKPKHNPILEAVSTRLDALPPAVLETLADQLGADITADGAKQLLLSRAPKRWVVYEPMVLLPSGSFTAAPWPALLSAMTPAQKERLWTRILRELSPPKKPPLTHLAINGGIPLHKSGGTETEPEPQENLLRTPTHLHPLHGDFGRPPSPDDSQPPTETDLTSALWVSTVQNSLLQTWSPPHTMFSRGNIREKARLLAFHSPFHSPPLPRRSTPAPLAGQWAVDLYAGIGYFALCYARLGLRVLCWEMNPWSVEGLRRGARGNGFSVRVVRPPSAAVAVSASGEVLGGGEVDLEEVLEGGEQIVVFLEDNRFAAGRVRRLRELAGGRLPVVHVNCGLLPRSDMVWRDAWEMVDGQEGWLHLHENVGEGDMERRRGEVQGLFDKWKTEGKDAEGKDAEGKDAEGKDAEGKDAEVEHVERVKTFAPGVWHCVFDVFITRPN